MSWSKSKRVLHLFFVPKKSGTMKRILSLLMFFGACWSINAQTTSPNSVSLIPKMENPADMWLNPSTTDYKTIVEQVEAYFEAHPNPQKPYKKFNRWKWFNSRHLDVNGQLTNTVRRNMDALENMPAPPQNITTSGYWSEVGPTNYTRVGSGHNGGLGRVNVIAFHPSNGNIIYVGTPAGGLWRTTNGGSTWTPLTDGLPRIGVSGIAIQPNNPNVIYILTGDGDGGDTQGIGVLKTTNGGQTWQETGLSWDVTQFRRGYKLLMHPTSYNTLFAATTGGLYKTTNGGSTWALELSGSINDVEFKPGDPTIMYAARRSSSAFYRSTDSGANWTYIDVDPNSSATITRLEIGVTPDNPNYVYALTGPATASGEFRGVYRSFDSGANFGPKADTPNILGYPSDGSDDRDQSGYDLAIAVSPLDEADVITGGINIWKSTNFGNSFFNLTQWNEISATTYSHADIHELVYNPVNNYLYCGSDGGIFRSTNHGTSWTDLSSGLQIMQFYHIDIDEGDSNDFIGGTQDNGTNYRTTNTTTFNHIEGGDGFDSMIDWNNPNILYLVANRSIYKSTNAGASISNITPPGETEFFPFLAQQHNAANTIFVGGDDVHRSTNGGSTWTNLGSNGEEGIVQGISNTNRFYATSGFTLQRSNNILAANPTWTTISNGTGWLGTQAITDMCVYPNNSLRLYITKGGYTADEKVLVTFNGGDSWTNLSAGLPNVPILSILYQEGSNDGIYVGTSIGVFYRDNTLGGWVPFRNGLPNTMVTDLEYNSVNGKVYAGTFGRGFWESLDYSPCPTSYFLTDANLPGTGSSSGYRYYQASSSITSSRDIDGGVGTEIHYKAGGSITLEEGFKVESGSWMRGWIGGCGSGVPNQSLQGDDTEIQGAQIPNQGQIKPEDQALSPAAQLGDRPEPPEPIEVREARLRKVEGVVETSNNAILQEPPLIEDRPEPEIPVEVKEAGSSGVTSSSVAPEKIKDRPDPPEMPEEVKEALRLKKNNKE